MATISDLDACHINLSKFRAVAIVLHEDLGAFSLEDLWRVLNLMDGQIVTAIRHEKKGYFRVAYSFLLDATRIIEEYTSLLVSKSA